jgi:hypothetical protein
MKPIPCIPITDGKLGWPTKVVHKRGSIGVYWRNLILNAWVAPEHGQGWRMFIAP